ncbi:MAG: c-type cytochrome [bacterium]|nr:c-type cytochrome [bacterium]
MKWKHLVKAVVAWATLIPTARAQDAAGVPSWIWHGEARDGQQVVFQKRFELSGDGHSAVFAGSCDNHMTVLLNGERMLSHDTWEEVVARDVSDALASGENVLEVRARNDGGIAALALRLTLDGERTIVTDASWRGASPEDAKAGDWSNVTVIGPVGGPGLAWTGAVTMQSYGVEATPAPSPQPQKARPAQGLTLLEGFEAERVYTVPKDLQGSWVALTRDDAGRLYASDQGGKGLYRITPATIGDPDAVTRVERIDVEVSAAQGMCWAFDSLYANVHGKGVWHITDTDGDDELDAARNLIPLGAGGEHGPHAILPTPDGTGLYFIGGNHVEPPPFERSRAPSNWGEDLLLPRQWDARGHARGKLAPGGWIARCDPDGTNVEILSSGYRNQYDIALDREGEMFTYDADMEWDLGAPWYRPTRVCHATSGSEFGWRSGTGKWPAYYEDSLPPVVDIGPGSPTGVVFGTGARFPAKYQDALFVLDWTFGTIYAIHLAPDGASFTGTKEHFAWAKPLAVTDAIVGADGALYFTVGGRGSQSALYRVIYTGPEPTATSETVTAGAEARHQRRALEAFHGRVDPAAVESAWPHLASTDRFLRFAARLAVENQPVETWRQRALDEQDPQAALVALIALTRQGGADDLAGVAAALDRLPLARLTDQQQLAALRAYALTFIRLGAPDDALRARVVAKLDPLLPAPSDAVNTELVRLLAYLRSPSVVEKTLTLIANAAPPELPPWAELVPRNDRYGGPIAKMLADMPPSRDIGYAFLLRNATEGWTMPLRKAYFRFFVKASKHPGGASFSGFLENMRADAEETLTVAERHALAPILGQSLVAPLPDDVTPPVGPGRAWTAAAALEAIGPKLTGRDFDKGRNLFHAVSCSACHRFDGEGGAIGPDLTTVANKFSVPDLVDSIVDPSRVISDQYGSHVVLDHDGEFAEGLLVEDEEEVSVYPRDHETPPIVFKRSEIAAIKASAVSQMPSALIDTLSANELKDLVAYLLSGGDKDSDVFQREAAGAGGKK